MSRAGDEGCTPRPPIRPQPASERRVVAVLFLGLLLDLLAFTLLLPLLPALLDGFARAHDPLYASWQRGVDRLASAIGMPAEKRYHSVLCGGLVGSGFSLLQFLSAPLTGAASDRLGRRPVMLLALGDRGRQQGQREPVHGHRGRPGLGPRAQPRHGRGRRGLLARLHAGPPARRLRARGRGALARAALRRRRPALHLLLPAGDAAPREAGALRGPGGAGRRRPAQPPGPAALLGRGPGPGRARGRQAPQAARPGPRLLPLPLPLLGPGVLAQLPGPPALPVQQPAAGEDVLLHRPHHGHRPGRLRPAHRPWQGARRRAAGHGAAGARLPAPRLGALAARAGPGAAALLLRGRRRGALPVLRGRRLRRGRPEGHRHGHAAQPGRAGQGRGAPRGRLRLLAGGGPALLLRVLGALPASRPPPPEAAAPAAQGRVAAPPRPRPEPQERGGRTGPGQGSPPHPPPWAPPDRASTPPSTLHRSPLRSLPGLRPLCAIAAGAQQGSPTTNKAG
ncbi:major facilitator superfamily domain-containing protein 10 isoform X1 [Dasypus novemcinctus]|uniref:major facilitator superfamily domain-containing protein 10 isoform X1 n=1 Tax=Dasypus novemcinctus TaxID=9361 RepID=UPI00265F7747|nr:major facilitator superfamily domain-containing protein 10 isoform X1 [Dasypus novemcinctus]